MSGSSKEVSEEFTKKYELLKKYNVPGPRYTSYPTVPYWEETPSEDVWIESISAAVKAGKKEGVGIALYVHIPFCEALCTYCGCNTRITRNHKVGQPYIDSVLKEWDLYLSRLKQDVQIGEIHLGGGTPTFLSPSELEGLVEGLLSRAGVSALNLKGSEYSLEADPRVTTKEHLNSLFRLGFRRLSLGIQDFDPKVQEIVHRVQSEAQVQVLTDQARAVGFTSINYDLIYGLPFQTLKSIEDTINAIRRLKPDRIAFYSYAHVPWIRPGQRRFTDADIPFGDEKRALYELGRKMLEDVGYMEVGMDHFALPTDSLWKAVKEKTLHRNFMGYIQRQVSPLIGLGVSAIGDSWSVFAQNEKLLETYQSRVESGQLPVFRGHILNQEDQVIRKHILNIMTQGITSWGSDLYKISHLSTIETRLAELMNDGIIELEKDSCRVTELGRPFMRNICMAFDARLLAKTPTTQIFSRTI